MKFSGNHIIVIGFGRSGQAAARLAVAEGARVTVLDDGIPGAGDWKGIEVIGRAGASDVPADSGLVVMSPGVPPDSELYRECVRRGIHLVGEMEFAFGLCKVPVVAITGTNGKTTTTEMIVQLLTASGQPSIAAGNYGLPLSEVIVDQHAVDVVTLEVSSFQLETIETFRPSISVWLNFAADHLDRYASIDDYRAAKMRIFENQTEEDLAIFKAELAFEGLRPQSVTFSASGPADYTFADDAIYFRGENVFNFKATQLRGLHNAENLMAALAVGRARGLSYAQMQTAIADYRTPEHRSELVRVFQGHEFINDSKATNLHALETALASQPSLVVLIAGGKDKGFRFDTSLPAVQAHASAVVAVGEMGEAILEDWGSKVPCELSNSLEAAVSRSLELASPGQTILFSPGTSSFDMFASYVERGEIFKAIVNQL